MVDGVRRSRTEKRFEDQIRMAKSQLEADCKRAELAAFQARLGLFTKSSKNLVELRGKNEREPNVNLSIWINFAEGILGYFSNTGVSKSDGVERAYALSVAVGARELRALCAAWLAQWDYSILDVERLALHAKEALLFASVNNHSARSRAALVVAQALHLAHRPDLAKDWYRKSRENSLAESDEITLSAILHNMAWLTMLNMRQTVLVGDGNLDATRYALLNAESTGNFDKMHGDTSWDELKPLLRAQILSLRGDFSDALFIYEQHLVAASGTSRIQANLLADKAWCHIQLGQMEIAQSCAASAMSSLVDDTQTDDRAAAHSRLKSVYEALGNTKIAKYHAAVGFENWQKHREMQLKIVNLLETLDPQVPQSSDQPN
jgi:tetratricopeptide (TPR) repeat protein